MPADSSYQNIQREYFYLQLRPEAPVKLKQVRNWWYRQILHQYNHQSEMVDVQDKLAEKLGISRMYVTSVRTKA